jgi:tetratricopeptide (TPR) repeat protein
LKAQYQVAEPLLREGLAAARDVGMPSAIGQMLCALGVPLYYRGMLDDSASLTEEAAGIFEQLGKATAACLIRGNLAAIRLAQGDLARARGHAEIAVQLARDVGDDAQLEGNLATLADVLLQQGELPRARMLLEEALRLSPRPLTTSEVFYLLARADLIERAPDRALRNVLRLRDVLNEHRIQVRVPMLVIAAALHAEARGRSADARRWLASVVCEPTHRCAPRPASSWTTGMLAKTSARSPPRSSARLSPISIRRRRRCSARRLATVR